MKNDVFVKNSDGSVYVGIVWPGESVFPDFTLTSVREWWGGLYKDFVGMGAAGFWNDMNEPALFQRADKTSSSTSFIAWMTARLSIIAPSTISTACKMCARLTMRMLAT